MSAGDAIRSSHSAIVPLPVCHLCEAFLVFASRSPANKKRGYVGGTFGISVARFSPR